MMNRYIIVVFLFLSGCGSLKKDLQTEMKKDLHLDILQRDSIIWINSLLNRQEENLKIRNIRLSPPDQDGKQYMEEVTDLLLEKKNEKDMISELTVEGTRTSLVKAHQYVNEKSRTEIKKDHKLFYCFIGVILACILGWGIRRRRK